MKYCHAYVTHEFKTSLHQNVRNLDIFTAHMWSLKYVLHLLSSTLSFHLNLKYFLLVVVSYYTHVQLFTSKIKTPLNDEIFPDASNFGTFPHFPCYRFKMNCAEIMESTKNYLSGFRAPDLKKLWYGPDETDGKSIPPPKPLLVKFEAFVVKMQELSLWTDPKSSLVAIAVVHMLYWYLSITSNR